MAKRQSLSVMQAGDVPTSAEIQALYAELHDYLTPVCGLVQAGDTGQLASFAGLTIGSSYTVTTHGYRIYRMNDALASVAPIYVKVVYRYFQSSRACPWPLLTFGQGSNGAGVITGVGPSVCALEGMGTGYVYYDQANAAVRLARSNKSFGCGGEGFCWLAFHADGINYATTEPAISNLNEPVSYSFRPVAGDGVPLLFFSLFRHTDRGGNLLDTGFSVIAHNSSTRYSSTAIYNYGGIQANVVGSAVSSERMFLGASTINGAMRGGKASLTRVMIPSPLNQPEPVLATPMMGAVPVAAALADGEVLAGVTLLDGHPHDYIHPTRCLAPLEPTPGATRAAFAPLLIWEGATV